MPALRPGARSTRSPPTEPRPEFFDPGEEYIWSLAFDEQGRLLVGTGGSGKIYRVMPDGTGTVWFESGQRHVMSLALDAAGNVLVGTDPDGILYRVSPAGAAFALHDADLPEVRAIAVGGDGAIFFAAMGGGMDRMLQGDTRPAGSRAGRGHDRSGRRSGQHRAGLVGRQLLAASGGLRGRARGADEDRRRTGR